MMKFGILGSGSWGTALAKLLTDNHNKINWWLRSDENIISFKNRCRNPQYLRKAVFDTRLIDFSSDPQDVIRESDVTLIVVPSAFVAEALNNLPNDIFFGKKILSAVKGILPEKNLLLNDFLSEKFGVKIGDYYTILGPCHAEELAEERLSYLTFSGIHPGETRNIADHFSTPYLRTLVNRDVIGAQFAAVVKNIYAIGAGMAHGLNYGDNFLSVLIANSADEMAGFLRKSGQQSEAGKIPHQILTENEQRTVTNYAASVYLGDLLVTCYSLYSRNRTFGNMIGKGYSVKAAQLEMNMIAEGYYASKCIFEINKKINADMPIAETIYHILWKGKKPIDGFKNIETILV